MDSDRINFLREKSEEFFSVEYVILAAEENF